MGHVERALGRGRVPGVPGAGIRHWKTVRWGNSIMRQRSTEEGWIRLGRHPPLSVGDPDLTIEPDPNLDPVCNPCYLLPWTYSSLSEM